MYDCLCLLLYMCAGRLSRKRSARGSVVQVGDSSYAVCSAIRGSRCWLDCCLISFARLARSTIRRCSWLAKEPREKIPRSSAAEELCTRRSISMIGRGVRSCVAFTTGPGLAAWLLGQWKWEILFEYPGLHFSLLSLLSPSWKVR